MPAELQHRGRIVDVHHPVLARRAGLHFAGITDHPRHAQRLLIHKPLVEPAVIAQEEAMVSGKDDDCVVRETIVVEKLEEPADVVILRLQRSQKVPHELLIVPLFALARRQVCRRMKIRHLRNPHAGLPRGCRAIRVVVVERAGLREAHVVVDMFVLVRWIEGPVRAEVLQHHEPRLLEFLDALHRKVGDVVGDVAGIVFLVNGVVAQLGIAQIAARFVVGSASVALEDEIVESGFAWIRQEVPLADDPGLISRTSQDLWERLLRWVEGGSRNALSRIRRIRAHAIQVAVFSGQQCGAARRAERVRSKAVLEPHALACNAVDIRRLHQLAAVAAQNTERNAFGSDPEDIRT